MPYRQSFGDNGACGCIVEEVDSCFIADRPGWVHTRRRARPPSLRKAFDDRVIHLNHKINYHDQHNPSIARSTIYL